MVRKNANALIEAKPGYSGGRPRIAGRRIRVQDVAIWHEEMHMSPQRIAEEYDLTVDEVQAALTYYAEHKQEIDKAIADDDAYVEEMRRKTPSLLEKEKLRKRK